NVEKGQFTKELEDAIWSLSPGQISPVIETRVGYHIVKVEVIEKPRQVPLKEVWEDIQNKIYFDRAEKIREEWIKKLKEEAFIEVNYASN
ncbi:MAG: PpiC-type peptidyl-prolyl cis-trans isomerase, partial [uncultured bacterium]